MTLGVPAGHRLPFHYLRWRTQLLGEGHPHLPPPGTRRAARAPAETFQPVQQRGRGGNARSSLQAVAPSQRRSRIQEQPPGADSRPVPGADSNAPRSRYPMHMPSRTPSHKEPGGSPGPPPAPPDLTPGQGFRSPTKWSPSAKILVIVGATPSGARSEARRRRCDPDGLAGGRVCGIADKRAVAVQSPT